MSTLGEDRRIERRAELPALSALWALPAPTPARPRSRSLRRSLEVADCLRAHGPAVTVLDTTRLEPAVRQATLHAVLVAKPHQSSLADIRHTTTRLRHADPVVTVIP